MQRSGRKHKQNVEDHFVEDSPTTTAGLGFEAQDSTLGILHNLQEVTVNHTPLILVYGQAVVVPVEFMVPSLRVVAEHDFDYNEILRVSLEKPMSLDEMRHKAI